MEKLNEYLQILLSTCSYELHLEPNKNPYIVSADGTKDVTNTPLLGTQISMMVFPLIPQNVKQQLPGSSEVEFTHPHSLGEFNFVVKKSSAGFNVTIRPMISNQTPEIDFEQDKFDEPGFSPNPVAAFSNSIAENSFEQFGQSETVYTEEPSSEFPPAENNSFSFQPPAEEYQPVQTTEENLFGVSQIETVPVNDADFMTVFSDISTYESPLKKSEFAPKVETVSDFESVYASKTDSADKFSFATEFVDDSQPIQVLESNTFFPENQNMQNLPPDFSAQPAQFPQQQFNVNTKQEESVLAAAQSNPQAKMRMDALFQQMAQIGASDLHLSVSAPPMVRKDGKMRIMESSEGVLSSVDMRELLTSIMPVKNQEEFSRRNDTDFAYEIPNLARFRANIFMDRKGMGGVFRIIPTKILTAEQLGLSPAIMNLCELSKGLVVVTGPTGSGKSTTLCAMVDSINKRRDDHIITI